MPKLQQVIIAEELRGDGKTEPWRTVVCVYDVDGTLIAERDTFTPSPPGGTCDAQHPGLAAVRCGRPAGHTDHHRNVSDPSAPGWAWVGGTP